MNGDRESVFSGGEAAEAANQSGIGAHGWIRLVAATGAGSHGE